MILCERVQQADVERHGDLISLRAGLLPPPILQQLLACVDAATALGPRRTLWGVHEAAAALDLPPSTFCHYAAAGAFPDPYVVLRCGRIWSAQDVVRGPPAGRGFPFGSTRRPWLR